MADQAAPKTKKAAEPKHTLTIHFTTAEDISLYKAMEAASAAERRSLSIYALLQLHKTTPTA